MSPSSGGALVGVQGSPSADPRIGRHLPGGRIEATTWRIRRYVLAGSPVRAVAATAALDTGHGDGSVQSASARPSSSCHNRLIRRAPNVNRRAHPAYGADATADVLTREGAGAAHVHLACQREFEVADPLTSDVEVADRRLSVRKILATRPFASVRLVVASMCKSVAFNLAQLPDEVVDLPAGILCRVPRS